jgi:hypothetical protein
MIKVVDVIDILYTNYYYSGMSLNLQATKCNTRDKYAFHVYKDDVYIVTLESEKDLASDIEARLTMLSTFEEGFSEFLDVAVKEPMHFANKQEALDYISNLFSEDIMPLFAGAMEADVLAGFINEYTTYTDFGSYNGEEDYDPIYEFKFYNLLNNIKIDDTEDNALILELIVKDKPDFIYNNMKLKINVFQHLFID